MIHARIVADSINPTGNRLTTWLLRYPRITAHEELLTHRVFSRNSASSRAIPFSVNVRRILDTPFVPTWWGVKSSGMQAPEDVTPEIREQAEAIWLETLRYCAEQATRLEALGIHKQMPNRLIQCWSHIEVVLSGTEFKNFFALRDHPAAEPSLRELAATMRELYVDKLPESCTGTTLCATSWDSGYDLITGTGRYAGVFKDPMVAQDAWHLPFVNKGTKHHSDEEGDYYLLPLVNAIKESVAHCAWVSYGNLEGKEYTQEDVERVYTTLLGSQPIHASPAEHVAVACYEPHRHGNLMGWASWRSFLPGEAGGDYADPQG